MENTKPDSALPIAKNNGSYGELGHWGKRTGHRIRKKKLRLLVILLIGITTLFIADQGAKGVYPGTPSHPSPLDPNTIIWQASNPNSDGSEFSLSGFKYRTACKASTNCIQSFSTSTSAGPPSVFSHITGGSTATSCNSFTSASISVNGGDALVAEIYQLGGDANFGLTDSQGNTWTMRINGAQAVSSAYIFTAFAAASGSITVSGTGGALNACSWAIQDWQGVASFGNTNSFKSANAGTSGSDSLTLTLANTTSRIVELEQVGSILQITCGTVTQTTGQTVIDDLGCAAGFADNERIAARQNTSPVGMSWSGWTATGNIAVIHEILELVSNPTATNARPSVALSKSQVGDLSVASGKTLGFNFTWSSFSPNANAIIGMFLTINKTLPTTSNWSPYNDSSVVWMDRLSCTVSCGTNGTQTWRMRQYAIRSQGVGDTLQAEDIGCNASGSCFLTATDSSQAGSPSTVFNYGMNLLNYTGGTQAAPVCSFSGGVFGGAGCSWIANGLMPNGSPAASVSARTGLPAFQFQSQQYYLGLFALNNTSSQIVEFGFQNLNIYTYNTGTPVATPPNIDTGGFFGPVVKFFINGGVFILNQIMLYGAFLASSLQVAFNRIGLFFGWGPIGDNMTSFFSGIGSLFSQIGTVLGWVSNLVTSSISTIQASALFSNPYFAGLVIFMNDFKNAVGSGVIINMITQIAFWFPTSYMIILISFYFLLVMMNGLKGFFEWVHIVKWSSFALAEVFSRILQILIKFITAILGRLSVISPGHEFPKIPHLHPGPLPKIELGFREMALFHDPTAWFLSVTGIVFTFMWAGTTSSGLPSQTTSIINTMQSLTLTLFGISFMVLILLIPGWLLGKMAERGLITE